MSQLPRKPEFLQASNEEAWSGWFAQAASSSARPRRHGQEALADLIAQIGWDGMGRVAEEESALWR